MNQFDRIHSVRAIVIKIDSIIGQMKFRNVRTDQDWLLNFLFFFIYQTIIFKKKIYSTCGVATFIILK